jgi:hypothetical protein
MAANVPMRRTNRNHNALRSIIGSGEGLCTGLNSFTLKS